VTIWTDLNSHIVLFDYVQTNGFYIFSTVQKVPNFDARVSMTVHETLTEMENLQQSGHFLGPEERIFSIVETCSSKRPVGFALFMSPLV
jgi:hypothetical protein